jgi:hypothetical protein
VVSCVLRHIDLQQRLGSCSLVCKAWRTAGGAATSDVRMRYNYQGSDASCGRQLDSLRRWLPAHAAAVTQLCVEGCYGGTEPLQLPYATLQQLQSMRIQYHSLLPADSADGLQQKHRLAALSVAASSSNGSSGSSQNSLASLTSLTALDLEHVVSSLAGLPALTQLQQLQLQDVTPALPQHMLSEQQQQQAEQLQAQQQRQNALQQVMSSALTSLTRLTLLQLTFGEGLLCDGTVAPFSCLQQLQELDLFFCDRCGPETLAGLPACLSKLRFSLGRGGAEQPLGSMKAPVLSRLTAMQHLHLRTYAQCAIRPNFIRHMQQLQELKLRGRLSGDAVPLLLEALPLLGSLRSLVISVEQEGDELLPASDVARYSALVPASQHLTELQLAWDEDSAPLLAAGCGQHMFPVGRRWEHLDSLVLGVSMDQFVASVTAEEDAIICDIINDMPACFDSADVSRLVEGCPVLQQLWFPGLVARGVALKPLLALSQLVCLFVGRDMIDDGVAESALTKMTQLDSLGVYAALELTDHGLLAMTALKYLVTLEACGCGFSSRVSTDVWAA